MRGRYDCLLSKVRERDRIFPLNRSRMSKIALGVYDTLEITMGAEHDRRRFRVIEVSHREVVGFRAP